ncbi:MAG: TlpA family protein disulfide reductase [Fusobacteriaceae bacterium]|nr:TlpA family protein disulfide reductase [Fusobacteriaceae bacterium]
MKNLSVLLISLLFSSIIFAQELITLKAGESIPQFKYYTMKGEEKDSKDLAGKKVLINFTSTWCPYCIEEKVKFEQGYKSLKANNEGIEIIVFFGTYGKKIERRDTKATVEEYMKKNNYTFPIYFDADRSVIEKFGAKVIPTTFFVDEKGKIVEVSEEYYKLKNLKK